MIVMNNISDVAMNNIRDVFKHIHIKNPIQNKAIQDFRADSLNDSLNASAQRLLLVMGIRTSEYINNPDEYFKIITRAKKGAYFPEKIDLSSLPKTHQEITPLADAVLLNALYRMLPLIKFEIKGKTVLWQTSLRNDPVLQTNKQNRIKYAVTHSSSFNIYTLLSNHSYNQLALKAYQDVKEVERLKGYRPENIIPCIHIPPEFNNGREVFFSYSYNGNDYVPKSYIVSKPDILDTQVLQKYMPSALANTYQIVTNDQQNIQESELDRMIKWTAYQHIRHVHQEFHEKDIKPKKVTKFDSAPDGFYNRSDNSFSI